MPILKHEGMCASFGQRLALDGASLLVLIWKTWLMDDCPHQATNQPERKRKRVERRHSHERVLELALRVGLPLVPFSSDFADALRDYLPRQIAAFVLPHPLVVFRRPAKQRYREHDARHEQKRFQPRLAVAS